MATTAQLALLWTILGGWVGAMLFFAAGVAPSAFAVLDTPAQAGRMVSRTLTLLHLGGALAGVAVALLVHSLGRGGRFWAPALLLAALCLLSHFGVSAALAELRPSAIGPEADPAARARFARLHGASVALLGVTLMGAASLLVALAHTLRPPVSAGERSENS